MLTKNSEINGMFIGIIRPLTTNIYIYIYIQTVTLRAKKGPVHTFFL